MIHIPLLRVNLALWWWKVKPHHRQQYLNTFPYQRTGEVEEHNDGADNRVVRSPEGRSSLKTLVYVAQLNSTRLGEADDTGREDHDGFEHERVD